MITSGAESFFRAGHFLLSNPFLNQTTRNYQVFVIETRTTNVCIPLVASLSIALRHVQIGFFLLPPLALIIHSSLDVTCPSVSSASHLSSETLTLPKNKWWYTTIADTTVRELPSRFIWRQTIIPTIPFHSRALKYCKINAGPTCRHISTLNDVFGESLATMKQHPLCCSKELSRNVTVSKVIRIRCTQPIGTRFCYFSVPRRTARHFALLNLRSLSQSGRTLSCQPFQRIIN